MLVVTLIVFAAPIVLVLIIFAFVVVALIVVALVVSTRLAGRQRAEQAVGFVVQSGGEKQRIARAGCRVVSEAEAPKPVDVDGLSFRAAEQPFKLAVRVECRDLAAAELADQEPVAPLAEIGGRMRHAPGSIHPLAVL